MNKERHILEDASEYVKMNPGKTGARLVERLVEAMLYYQELADDRANIISELQWENDSLLGESIG